MGNQNSSFSPAIFTASSRAGSKCGECESPASAHQGCACSTHSSDASETHVYFDTCDGQQSICVTGVCEDQQQLGRVLDVTTTLENVCPGRRSAVGLTLSEVDENGAEYARGFRAISVPAHHGSCSRDVQLDAVRFILPEDMSLQRRRHFVCRVNHHYLDADSIWG